MAEPEAQAVMEGLAGFMNCPRCEQTMVRESPVPATVHITHFHCSNQSCPVCCVDGHGAPLGCRKQIEDPPISWYDDEFGY